MTVLPINLRTNYGSTTNADQQTVAQLSGQIARIDGRVNVLEVARMELGANTIDNSNLQAGSVTGSTIYPGSIVTSHIQAGSIDASVINASSIGAAVGTFVSINASQIVAGDITVARMQANVISAVQASISTLSAIAANMGSITAGTITGATFQTAASSVSRVVLDTAGLRGYALDGVTKTFELNTGTGIASFTGVATLDPTSIVPIKGLVSSTASGFMAGGNALADSSFESSDPALPGSLWTNSGVTAAKSTTQAFHGTKALAVTYASGTDPYVTTGLAAGALPNVLLPSIKGKPVIVSAWVYVPAATAASGKISSCPDRSLLASDGVAINSVPIVSVPADTWTRVVVKMTISTSATGYAIRLYNPFTTGPVYYDGVQVELGDVPTAYSPRPDEILYSSINALMIGAGEVQANNIAAGAIQAQHISLSFGSPNRLINPGFENNSVAANTNVSIPGWDNTSGVTTQRSTTQFRSGTSSAKITASSTGTVFMSNLNFRPGVIAGQKYAFSAYVQDASGGKQVLGRIMWYDATSTQIGSTADATITPGTSGTWVRFVAAGTAPAGAVTARCLFYILLPAVSDAVYVEEAQFELGGDASPWAPNPNEVLPGSVGNTQIAPDAITTDKILAGTILAADMTVSQLSAIAADLGTITAGTITSATVQTAASGARAVMDSSGFRIYDSGGVQRLTQNAGGLSTNTSTTRIDFNDVNGLSVWNAGVMTAQLKPGGGGLDLLAGTTFTPTERKVRWNTTGGTNIAYIGCYGDGTGPSDVEYFVKEQTNGLTASHDIIARQAAGTSNTGALLQVQSLSGSTGGKIVATVYSASGGVQDNATILDGTGASGFVRAPSPFTSRTFIYGPFSVSSGTWSSGETTVSYTHNLDLGSNQIISYHIEDGANASGVSCRVSKSNNGTTFILRNLTGLSISAVVNFCIIYFG